MKYKYLKVFVVLFFVFLISGCNSDKKLYKEYNKNGLIIEYRVGSNYGTLDEMNNKYIIKLNSDKILSYGYKNDEELKSKKLTQKQFEEIINYAFSKDIISLNKDLSDPNTLDGSSSYITIYYDNNESKTMGGLNPNNEKYSKLIKLLYKNIN